MSQLPSQNRHQAQGFLDWLNEHLLQERFAPPETFQPSQLLTPPTKERLRQADLDHRADGSFLHANSTGRLEMNRQALDEVLDRLHQSPLPDAGAQPAESPPNQAPGESGNGRHNANGHSRGLVSPFTGADAARSARRAAASSYQLRRRRTHFVRWALLGFAALVIAFLCLALRDTYANPQGEPFLLFVGVSVWPTELIRLTVVLLAAVFVVQSHFASRTAMHEICREYRLPFARTPARVRCQLPATPVPKAVVDAGDLWRSYQQLGLPRQRICRIAPLVALYLLFAFGVMFLGDFPLRPVRGVAADMVDRFALTAVVVSFFFLTFWTMDTARLCRWFIEHLSEAPTHYPQACHEHFRSTRALPTPTPERLLNKWIDMRLIATLTERIGRLVYYPFILLPSGGTAFLELLFYMFHA